MVTTLPLAIWYEHEHWFKPLFQELTKRGLPFEAWHADGFMLQPAAPERGSRGLIFNRMSPSAGQRGRGGAVLFTAQLLHYWQVAGYQVVNGAAVYGLEVSKALQVALLLRLGLPVPRTVVVHRPEDLPAAAARLEGPFVVKPNIGGSGAGIVLFETAAALGDAAAAGQLPNSLDGVLLVQEYHAPAGRWIQRVETIAGKVIYGIRIGLGDSTGFDLCPADICRSTAGNELRSEACPVEARKNGLVVECMATPSDVAAAVERIAAAAELDVGGIEYLHSSRDGQLYFYDINALSNFVADPVQVVGLDPTSLLVDELWSRLQRLSAEVRV